MFDTSILIAIFTGILLGGILFNKEMRAGFFRFISSFRGSKGKKKSSGSPRKNFSFSNSGEEKKIDYDGIEVTSEPAQVIEIECPQCGATIKIRRKK